MSTSSIANSNDTTNRNNTNLSQQQEAGPARSPAQYGYSQPFIEAAEQRDGVAAAAAAWHGDMSSVRLDDGGGDEEDRDWENSGGEEEDDDDDDEEGERGGKRKPKRAQMRAAAKELKRNEKRAGHVGDNAEHNGDEADEEGTGEAAGSRGSDLLRLPLETVGRILAYLDPISLARCASVCKTFAAVVRDDATWRQAFSVHYRIERGGTGGGGLLRRLDGRSWKHEYTRRNALLRQWRKAKSPTVISDARVSTIDAVALSLPHHFMLSASLTYGVASRCDPFTGKIVKGFVDAAGQVNGAGFGPMNVDAAGLDVSSVAIESDASRIVWGFHTGEVAMTILQKQGTNPRGAIKAIRFAHRHGGGFGIGDGHAGPVLDIAMPFGTARGGAHSIERKPEKLKQRQASLGEVADTFVTAGLDGTVRLWSPRRTSPLWTAVAVPKKDTSRAARPAPVVCVEYDVDSGTIAAGTSEGDVVVWASLDVDALLRLPTSAWQPQTSTDNEQSEETSSVSDARAALQRIQTRVVKVELGRSALAAAAGPAPKIDDNLKAVSRLILDVDETASLREPLLLRLLVLPKHAHSFERIDVNLSESGSSSEMTRTLLDVRRASYENPTESEFTSLRPDFDLAPRRSTLREGTSNSNGRSAPTSPLLLSSSSSTSRGGGNRLPHLVLGPSLASTSTPESALYAERKFVCAGTKTGRLLFWDWSERLGEEERVVPASLSLDAHHTSITALDLVEHVVMVGCSDGTIKAFCPLTGSLVRTFNDRTATRHPARMLAAGELSEDEASRFTVTSIVAGTETVVAAIGSQVLAWRAEKLVSKGSSHGKRMAAPRSSSSSFTSASGRQWQRQKEMEHDVYETKAQLQVEQEKRQASYERYRYAVGPPEIGGLSEQEAFEYAMMLSRDEEEARRRSGAAAGTSAFPRRLPEMQGHENGKGKHRSMSSNSTARHTEEEETPIDWELEDALEQIALAESRPPRNKDASASSYKQEGEADEADSSLSQSASRSPSPSPSPLSSPPISGLATPSRAWDILNNAGSLARASQHGEERWRPNNKVRTVRVPREARLSSTPGDHSASMDYAPHSNGLYASSSMTARRASHADARPNLSAADLSSPTDFPAFSSPLGGRGTPSMGASPSPCGSLTQSQPKPQGAWAQGSPALRPTSGVGNSSSRTTASSSSTSLSSMPNGCLKRGPSFSPLPSPRSPPLPARANYKIPTGLGADTENNSDMDDDLRFAIELSLAEARSRKS